MAESAVQSAIEEQQDFFVVDVDELIRSLRNKLKRIHALLNDKDGIRRENEIVKLWVHQIIEVAYNTEDVIDSIFESAQQRGGTSAGLMSYQSTFARGIKDIPAIQDVGKEIIDIERKLNEISSNISQYSVDNIQACGEASTSLNQNQIQREKRAPSVREADVFGIEDATRTLLGRLMGGDMRRDVISITGMGGISKTTLVKKVYNNVHVKKSFDFQCWVNVPQEYRVREILASTFYCFPVFKVFEETVPEDDLRRVLVVIDDIWDSDAWDGLVTAFPDRHNGSRVMLTTRNEDIAKYADAQSTPYKIRFLNENESWALFCKKALVGNPAPVCPSNLEELGRKMVAKCGGLPLAIAVLGGVLSRKDKTVNEWEKVLKSVVWWLHESKDGISGILALSYHDLPYYLKPCFLYFGAFPEDSEISVDKLIRMWIAEGFMQRRGGEEMEDIAEDYLEELISRSMIQVAKRKSNGMAEKCCIHDLLRDLAISKAKEERFLNVYGNIAPTSPTLARRLAITCGDMNKCISLNISSQHLCSVLEFSKKSDMPEKLALKILGGAFKFLRVMYLQSQELCRLGT